MTNPHSTNTLKTIPSSNISGLNTNRGVIRGKIKNEVPTGQKYSTWVWEEKNNNFEYHGPFANHFVNRQVINDHKNIRHYSLYIEKT